MKVLLLAVTLLLPAMGPSFAHDEKQLVQVHQICRTAAASVSSAKLRNASLQRCLRGRLTGKTCRHESRAEAHRVHNVSHKTQAHRQCRLAMRVVCHSVKSPSRCESAVMHDCLKTENLCVSQGFRRVPN